MPIPLLVTSGPSPAPSFTLTLPAAHGQMLARPGWAGSGMNAAPWWKHAVVYRADPHSFGGLHGLAEHLDYVRSLGSDALRLTSLGGDASNPIDPSLGTIDDVDEIIRRASQDNLRVLVEIDSSSASAEGKARLWLTHGVARLLRREGQPRAARTAAKIARPALAGKESSSEMSMLPHKAVEQTRPSSSPMPEQARRKNLSHPPSVLRSNQRSRSSTKVTAFLCSSPTAPV